MPKTQKTWKLMGAGNRQEYELRHLKLTMTRKITIFHTDSGGYSCYIIRSFHAESWRLDYFQWLLSQKFQDKT